MPQPDPLMLAVAAALSCVLAVVFVYHALGALGEWKVRKKAFGSLSDTDQRPLDDAQHASVVRASSAEDDDVFTTLAERIPQLWDLQHLLAQSGLGWTFARFVLMTVAFSVVLGVVAAAVSGALVGLVAFLVGGWLPYLHVRRRKARRVGKLESQLPETIDLIARAVRAGHPLSEGIRMAAHEAPEPLASEFRVTFEEHRFGLPFEDALLGLGDRVEVVDMRILITAILVQREVGGNLSETLERIAETMRARFNLKRQVRVYTAQGRMSGYTLAALPIFVGLVVSLINPTYMQTLFRDPLGQAMLGGAAFMQVIGFLWIRRIVDIRY